MIVEKNQALKDFKPFNHNSVKQIDNLRYFGVYLDDKSSWKATLMYSVLYFQKFSE